MQSQVDKSDTHDNEAHASYVEHSISSLQRLADLQKGKWVALENGIRAERASLPDVHRYTFDKPGDDYLPVDVAIKYKRDPWAKPKDAIIVFSSETQVDIELPDDLGQEVSKIVVKADARNLIFKLCDRLRDSMSDPRPIALELALGQRSDFRTIDTPPNERDVIETALNQNVTFVWGPPGTGKTHQLSILAEKLIVKGLRVLMVSGTNVAVDGATRGVGHRLGHYPRGTVLRYGNPRSKELDDQLLSSRSLARASDKGLNARERALLNARESAIAQEQFDIENELRDIRRRFRKKESELVHQAQFLATTLARATVDPTVYEQDFDVVLYDEVGMALVPQVVFAGSLASKMICCFGDFRQLPPIVDDRVPELKQDIFDKLGITTAVDEGSYHDLLVMLTEQHRCHPDIASFVSHYLYGDLLTTNRKTAEETTLESLRYQGDHGAVCLVDLSGMPSLGLKDSSSHFNLMSASVCVQLAKSMPKDWRIAIITPYKSQAQIVRGMIRDVFGSTERVRSATVHSFQGMRRTPSYSMLWTARHATPSAYC